ncbi:MAG: hypothetical protein ACD_81C00110G0002 [uncultured bacterium]|nr:MAG: hypothetical protein ACD_81C00110G0002 [uncultured bacterium]
MTSLTFLLPLKDRPDYTKIWLDKNLRTGYDYIIADGSIGDENEALFRDLELPNVTYARCQKDLTIDRYVEKMLHAVGQVKTKYVMTCDNDDFINFRGIVRCLDALENDSMAICAGGPIYGVYQSENASTQSRYSLPLKILDLSRLDNRSGFDALAYVFRNYGYLWYSIFRTEGYRKIWNDIARLQILDVFLMEILQAELTFCYGKYIHVKSNHYIRLINPTTSSAREASSIGIPQEHRIYFDDEYRRQVLRMSEHVAALVGVDRDKFLDAFRYMYLNTKSIASRIRTRLSHSIQRKIIKYFPVLSVESILALTNPGSRKAES